MSSKVEPASKIYDNSIGTIELKLSLSLLECI